MKIVQIPGYVCEICNTAYSEPEKATACETRRVTGDKGAKVGDTVIITGGEGAGRFAKVTSVGVCSRDYGHYAWEKYWHTVWVAADILDHYGSRILLLDQYEPVRETK